MLVKYLNLVIIWPNTELIQIFNTFLIHWKTLIKIIITEDIKIKNDRTKIQGQILAAQLTLFMSIMNNIRVCKKKKKTL